MGGLLNASSVLQCPHGGMVQVTTSDTKIKAAGDYVLRTTDTFTISGCTFNLGPAGGPHPCVSVKWVVSALDSTGIGDSNLTKESVGLCQAADQAVQGTVLINVVQQQVTGQ